VRANQPGFFWQGVLIVLPAILLGGVCFYSLRQDRLLAEREAAQQGKLIADSLARDLLPRAFALELPERAALERWRERRGRPQDDPLLALARRPPGRVACLLRADGALLLPPPVSRAPAPEPLDEADLDPKPRADWAAICGPAASGEDPGPAIAAGQRLLDQGLPGRFAAAVCYRLGLFELRAGQTNAARELFERVATLYPEAVAETGYELAGYARVQLLKSAAVLGLGPTRREELIDALGAAAVAAPSPLSASLLAQIAAATTNAPSVTAWQEVAQTHDFARTLYSLASSAGLFDTAQAPNLKPAAAGATPGGLRTRCGWLRLTHTNDWLAFWQPAEGNHWLLAMPEEQVRGLVREALRRLVLPPYLGVSIELAGRSVAGADAAGQVLAGGAGSLGPGSATQEAQVAVRLTAPGQLYAWQRKRTIWFGGLAAAAVAAVVAGFFTAWGAFRRQRQLGELKSNFVSAVSHELRAPIASIRLMSEELEDIAAPDPARSRGYHHLINQECRRLSWLIENVLDFSRHEQGRERYNFEPTDVRALVEATVKLMQVCADERQVRLTATFQGDCQHAEVDGRALQQALVNLLDNAIKHSPARAGVTVGVECDAVSPAGPGPDGRGAPALRLWVEDVGEGIPPEEHERIFERFYRRGPELRRETQGIGLGLAIVRYVAQAHGGKVTVRSALGQGSRFTLELPLVARSQQDGPV